MSHFYAEIQGNRSQATRGGSAKSGIDGHIRGWFVGGAVQCFVNEQGQDVVQLFATRGSSGATNKLIAEFTTDTFDQCGKCQHGFACKLQPFYCGDKFKPIPPEPNLIEATRQHSKRRSE